MTAISFKSASDLADYVNDNSIPSTDISEIINVGGRWWLFHY